ncbi:MAG: gliding motility-associated-like protein, partial [Bacteroidia bacterium]
KATDSDSFPVVTFSQDSLQNLKINWGDGTIDSYGSGVSPTDSLKHLYTQTGSFQVILSYADSLGCADTIYALVINERVPTAGIVGPNSGFNIGCAPFSITFSNNSKNISNGTTFLWSFGDGELRTLNYSTYNDSTTHTYTNNLCGGTVQLTASNACGYSLTTWNPIHISKKDVSAFVIDSSNCDPSGYYEFTNFATDSFCLIPDNKSYYWDFGDGTNSGWISSKAKQFHSYANQGPKTVCLISKNGCGSDTFCYDFDAMYWPVAGFILDTTKGCSQVEVTATDTSIGFKTTRLWDFGDGSYSTNKTVKHTYTKLGTYTLKLSVTNVCGTSTKTETIIVYNPPKAAFTGANDGCATHQVQLSNASTTDFQSTVSYHWFYGNGQSSTGSNAQQQNYSDSGTYELMLIMSDSCGADTFLDDVRVDLYPTISILSDTLLCTFDSILFVNKSTNYDQQTINFGDGSSTHNFTSDTIKHAYKNGGRYLITINSGNKGRCFIQDTFSIVLLTNAKSGFSFDASLKCAPASFVLTNTSNDANTFWWYINDSLFSRNSNPPPVMIATDTTLFSIKLVALDSNKCYKDSTIDVGFTPKDPVAIFVNDVDSICVQIRDSLHAASLHTSINWWEVGGQSTQDSFYVFTQAINKDSFYLLRLIAQNWFGCTDSVDGYRKLYPKPLTRFVVSDTAGCGPLTTQFTNLSTPLDTGSINIMSFVWNFGNDSISSNQKVGNQTYLKSKTADTMYNVTLIGISEHGCQDTNSHSITVFSNPLVAFRLSDTAGCGPLQVSTQNISNAKNGETQSSLRFLWDFGNGEQATSIDSAMRYTPSLDKDTFYTMRLYGTSLKGCADSASQIIQVHPKPLARFAMNVNEACHPVIVSFTNTSLTYDTSTLTDMSFTWTSSAGFMHQDTNFMATFNQANFTDTTYWIQLIAASEHGCLDTLTKNVLVHPLPNAIFSSSVDSGCGPLTVDFKNLSLLNDTNYWDLGSGFSDSPADTMETFNHVPLKDTTYRISLYVKTRYNCFSDTVLKDIVVKAQPIADFTKNTDTACYYDPIIFTNTSTGAQTYKWLLGDGNTSTKTSLTHWYSEQNDPYSFAIYTVKLYALTPYGCTDSTNSPVVIRPYSIAQINTTLDSACSPLNVDWSNGSTNNVFNAWDLGDGDSSNQPNPNHTYSNISNVVRTRRVILHILNIQGCIDSDTTYFSLLPEPVAEFHPFRLSVCDSGYFKLINTSINNAFNNWQLLGKTSTKNEPTELFARSTLADTTHLVQLIVRNGYQCSDTTEKNISINPWQTVQFDTAANYKRCVLQNQRWTDASSFTTFYRWKFGDGAESVDQHPTYFYKAPGLYTVELVGYDKNGCADSVISVKNIEVVERPISLYQYDPPFSKLPNSTINFTNLSTPANGLNFFWDFDDQGVTSNVKDPQHTFSDSGTYIVSLIATNLICSDTSEQKLYIEPHAPISNFSISSSMGCKPFTVQFTESTIHANTFRWYFDDGTESREANPRHTFEREGKYTITLISYGPGGATDTSSTDLIEVYPNPFADFVVTPVVHFLPNPIFSTYNTSVGSQSYLWNVLADRNGELVFESTHKDTSFILHDTGTFTVKLLVTNEFGCKDTLAKLRYLHVLAGGHVYIPNAFTPHNSDDINAGFKPLMSGVKEDGYLFRVYNRWGEKLFETSNLNQAWNGKVNDEEVQLGMYIYTVKYRLHIGTEHKENGTVTVLR